MSSICVYFFRWLYMSVNLSTYIWSNPISKIYMHIFSVIFVRQAWKTSLPACSFKIRNVSHTETLWAATWQSFVATFIINVVATSTRPWGNWNPNLTYRNMCEQHGHRLCSSCFRRVYSKYRNEYLSTYDFMQPNSQPKIHIRDLKRGIQFVIKKKPNVKLVTQWKEALSWVTTCSRVMKLVIQFIVLY